jgi:cis-3-alkyl-4-acyloxetan-2-one decarboxylase
MVPAMSQGTGRIGDDGDASTLRRRDLHVGGARLAIFEAGRGEPLVLLHGYPQSHGCWRHLIPALAAERRVIAPDWFGWGESERSFALAPRFEDEVARVGALFDALDLPQADVFAHDYGGLLALAFAIANPGRVRRLALINTRAHRTMAGVHYVQWVVLPWLARVPGVRWLFARLPWYRLHQRALRRHVANGSFTAEELGGYLAWMRHPTERLWFAHFCRHFRIGARRELGEQAHRLTMPVAVIWGDRDPYFPFAIGEDLVRLLPRGRLTRLAGADHYVLEQRPAEVLSALRELLAT